MKKFFLFGLVLTLLISCKDDITESPQVGSDWENFGEANLNGTKFISEYIQSNTPPNGRLSEEGSNELILEATDEYLKSEGISDEERQSAREYLETVLTSDEEPYYNEEVTEMQASFIAALELAFQQEVDFETTISYIERLEQQAYELLSEEEIDLVLMATTTAKNQSTYWFENLNGNSINGRVMCVSSWKQVGVKAIAGALGGAATCGAARFFGPVGWKVWGACIVGGAAGVAVEEIVEQCLAPNQATTQNCLRYSGGNIAACGGFLNYGSLIYGRSPYTLLNLPIQSFP